jgi:hypothetical protein
MKKESPDRGRKNMQNAARQKVLDLAGSEVQSMPTIEQRGRGWVVRLKIEHWAGMAVIE